VAHQNSTLLPPVRVPIGHEAQTRKKEDKEEEENKQQTESNNQENQ
jgi:hypothetical protein